MLGKVEVPVMMTRVQLALSRAGRDGEVAPFLHFVTPEGEDSDLSYLRRSATISLEFHSGSARPVIGPVIVAAKRQLRRCLRWYLAPIVTQQSRFNHATLDLIEKLRMEHEQLRARLAELAEKSSSG